MSVLQKGALLLIQTSSFSYELIGGCSCDQLEEKLQNMKAWHIRSIGLTLDVLTVLAIILTDCLQKIVELLVWKLNIIKIPRSSNDLWIFYPGMNMPMLHLSVGL